MPSVFITGTDTGVGKTVTSCALLQALRLRGLKAIGMKPIASGCRVTPLGLRNDDAEALITASGLTSDYSLINPYAFAEPIAPHLAAAAANTTIELKPICLAYQRLKQSVDHVIVEGVGGWAVPLSNSLMQADLVRSLDLPVILVVGLRLGCINHALLSARAITAEGLRFVGWVANSIDPQMLGSNENIDTLQRHLGTPLLGILPYKTVDYKHGGVSQHLNLDAAGLI